MPDLQRNIEKYLYTDNAGCERRNNTEGYLLVIFFHMHMHVTCHNKSSGRLTATPIAPDYRPDCTSSVVWLMPEAIIGNGICYLFCVAIYIENPQGSCTSTS